MNRLAVVSVPIGFLFLVAPPRARAADAPRPRTSCLECHEEPDKVVMASVHGKHHVSCVACHGGNVMPPKGELPEEVRKQKAHDVSKGYDPKPEKACVKCHRHEADAFAKGAHAILMRDRAATLCRECHAADRVKFSAHTITARSCAPGGLPGRVRTGADSTFVHRVPLADGAGRLVEPKTDTAYSSYRTCRKCHDVESIGMGRHFQAGRPGAPEDGRPGEPWILWDAATLTQVPLSYRAWEGAGCRKPAEFGLTDWDFALRFGPHHPGGGPLEWLKGGKRRDTDDESLPPGAKGPAPRWKVAGALEIDCLLCHAATGYSPSDRHDQIRAHNFRWAPAAAAGVGSVSGKVKDLPPSVVELPPPDDPPDDPKLAGPKIVYGAGRFDATFRVELNVSRRPPAEKCLYCHAVRIPRAEAASPDRDRDVHLAAGMTCADCHRNGIDHRIARGDGSDLDRKNHPDNATLSCRGCHATGRLGAPPIPHRGLPAFHLDKIACTTCHSGPFPEDRLQAVQLARVHGLGLPAESDLDARDRPAVRAPLYRRDDAGLVRPYYAVWPMWWGERKDGRPVPIPIARAKEAIEAARVDAGKTHSTGDAKADPKANTKAGAKTGAEPDDGAVLAKLKERGVADPVRIAGGRLYRAEGGRLISEESRHAEPACWPIAHNVRPARQALGAAACSDCHSCASPFFFGTAAAEPAGPSGLAVKRSMHVYLGMSPTAIRVGAAAVVMREAGMRHIAVLCVLGLLVVSLVHLVAGARLARLAGVPEAAASGPAPDLGAPIRWVHACAWALMLALVATGVGFLVTYGPSPLPTFFSSRWAVRLHVAAGLAFAGLAPLLALAWIAVGLGRRRAADWLNAWGGFLWMARGRGDGKLSAVNQFWIWVDFLCCLAVAATGVIMAMRVPSVGRLAPEALRRLADHALVGPLAYAIHGLAGSVLIARLAGHLYALIFFRKRGGTPVPPGC